MKSIFCWLLISGFCILAIGCGDPQSQNPAVNTAPAPVAPVTPSVPVTASAPPAASEVSGTNNCASGTVWNGGTCAPQGWNGCQGLPNSAPWSSQSPYCMGMTQSSAFNYPGYQCYSVPSYGGWFSYQCYYVNGAPSGYYFNGSGYAAVPGSFF